MVNNNNEPASAPQPDRWYNMRLGSTFKDNSSAKFCTLRYEFKPASIDKSQPGSLHKNKENRVTVEFNNNQPGKRNVSFQGSLEDYKDNDAVLFFDGETFRLERLHRAVKRLRHVRLPEEHAAAANMASGPSVGTTPDSRSPPIGRMAKTQPLNKTVVHPVHVEVERIDIGEPDSPGPTRPVNKNTEFPSAPISTSPTSPDAKSPELEINLDIFGDDDGGTPNKTVVGQAELVEFDMNMPNQNDTDDEIADVDVGDEADEGPNAAEALRAQVNATEEQQQETDSSSGSGSRSSSSGSSSGSGTSSSDSDGSDDDSASSGGDVDI
ncbi:ell-associated factor Eaf [Canna indica]|uniref:Ell-associated factor Eaf n=1 Tax=Canna indica TaxID=4628 RepID=A0AAQ3KMQ3_9LILI|nr:ell-associated factor Eaf [Canna indica]